MSVEHNSTKAPGMLPQLPLAFMSQFVPNFSSLSHVLAFRMAIEQCNAAAKVNNTEEGNTKDQFTKTHSTTDISDHDLLSSTSDHRTHPTLPLNTSILGNIKRCSTEVETEKPSKDGVPEEDVLSHLRGKDLTVSRIVPCEGDSVTAPVKLVNVNISQYQASPSPSTTSVSTPACAFTESRSEVLQSLLAPSLLPSPKPALPSLPSTLPTTLPSLPSTLPSLPSTLPSALSPPPTELPSSPSALPSPQTASQSIPSALPSPPSMLPSLLPIQPDTMTPQSTRIPVQSLFRHSSRKQRSRKKPMPEELKTPQYYARRQRNNEAAKKSRDQRKRREELISKKVVELQAENAFLKVQLSLMEETTAEMKANLFPKMQQT